MDLKATTFGRYIKVKKEHCGLEEQIQVLYIVSMAGLLKEFINQMNERTT